LKLNVREAEIQMPFDQVPAEVPELREKGYHFRNISREGRPSMLAVSFGDFAHAPAKGNMPIAIGYIALSHFSAGSNSFNRFIVADRNGTILFHSDERMIYGTEDVSKDLIFQDALLSSVNAGAKEYLSPKGVRTLGSYYKPGLDLVTLSQIDYDEAMKATYTLTEKFIILGLASLGLMIVLGLLFSRRVTAPLNRLFLATAQVSQGNFKVNLPISSRDEIGALTASFVAMSHRISDLVQGTADRVRVDQELEIVKTVHQSLFPPAKISNDELLLMNHYQSASECGGDWLGYFRNGRKHVIVIADATGHGRRLALQHEPRRDPQRRQSGRLRLGPGPHDDDRVRLRARLRDAHALVRERRAQPALALPQDGRGRLQAGLAHRQRPAPRRGARDADALRGEAGALREG
ncbi:MAG: HAMP domain-containing protein, partial [Deltaproteobacteria bacterium]|nr:HAMP domain-containing protein [Deltaproteobacteria bacterium]